MMYQAYPSVRLWSRHAALFIIMVIFQYDGWPTGYLWLSCWWLVSTFSMFTNWHNTDKLLHNSCYSIWIVMPIQVLYTIQFVLHDMPTKWLHSDYLNCSMNSARLRLIVILLGLMDALNHIQILYKLSVMQHENTLSSFIYSVSLLRLLENAWFNSLVLPINLHICRFRFSYLLSRLSCFCVTVHVFLCVIFCLVLLGNCSAHSSSLTGFSFLDDGC